MSDIVSKQRKSPVSTVPWRTPELTSQVNESQYEPITESGEPKGMLYHWHQNEPPWRNLSLQMSKSPIPTSSYPSEAGIGLMSLTLKKMVPVMGISYGSYLPVKWGVLWKGVVNEIPLENKGVSDTGLRETSIRIYQRCSSCSFFVLVLKPWQIEHLSLTRPSSKHFR